MGSFKEAIRRTAVFCVLAGAGLSACNRPPPTPSLPAGEQVADKDGYLASPSVTSARMAGGRLVLEGLAEKGARVRLATPQGEEQITEAGADGRWRIVAAAAAEPRIFGLSMTVAGRQIQAQGYVLVDADGAATLLRGGAGALRLNVEGAPRITTFDYDRAGGAVVSGIAPAGAVLQVRGDGEVLGEGRANVENRFSISIARPMGPGQHRLEVVGENVNASATVEVSPAAELVDAPFRASRGVLGLRADWMTPGGGVQTTLILN